MNTKNLDQAFNRHKPWISRFQIDGKQYGGDYDPSNDIRLKAFWDAFPTATRILELGSLEGAHSFLLGNKEGVREVVGVEGRSANIDKAELVKEALEVDNVRFIQADLETFDFPGLGSFDAIFCAGLLYHLPKPWELLARLPHLSANLLLATHYSPDDKANHSDQGHQGALYHEFGMKDPLSGLSSDSFWPTRQCLLKMVRDAGFANLEVFSDQTNHKHGPLITIIAKADLGAAT